MPDPALDTATDALSAAFTALGDPTRRDIIARLSAGPASVGAIAEHYPITVQAVSKHIAVLERAGLVHRSTPGRRGAVELAPQLLDLATEWIDRYRQRARQRDRRLDALLAERADHTPAAGPDPRGTPR